MGSEGEEVVKTFLRDKALYLKDVVEWELGARWQALAFHLRPPATNVIIKLLLQVNQHKNNALARRLHNIADEYDTRPTGRWR